jgi:hypothetical protein
MDQNSTSVSRNYLCVIHFLHNGDIFSSISGDNILKNHNIDPGLTRDGEHEHRGEQDGEANAVEEQLLEAAPASHRALNQSLISMLTLNAKCMYLTKHG